jgi:hypothetical protein
MCLLLLHGLMLLSCCVMEAELAPLKHPHLAAVRDDMVLCGVCGSNS